jgi:hypothetical protein
VRFGRPWIERDDGDGGGGDEDLSAVGGRVVSKGVYNAEMLGDLGGESLVIEESGSCDLVNVLVCVDGGSGLLVKDSGIWVRDRFVGVNNVGMEEASLL